MKSATADRSYNELISGSLIIGQSKIGKGNGWGIIVESNFGAKLNGNAVIQNEFEDLTLGAVLRQ